MVSVTIVSPVVFYSSTGVFYSIVSPVVSVTIVSPVVSVTIVSPVVSVTIVSTGKFYKLHWDLYI